MLNIFQVFFQIVLSKNLQVNESTERSIRTQGLYDKQSFSRYSTLEQTSLSLSHTHTNTHTHTHTHTVDHRRMLWLRSKNMTEDLWVRFPIRTTKIHVYLNTHYAMFQHFLKCNLLGHFWLFLKYASNFSAAGTVVKIDWLELKVEPP